MVEVEATPAVEISVTGTVTPVIGTENVTVIFETHAMDHRPFAATLIEIGAAAAMILM